MKINGKEITAKKFAYDNCHKMYLIEDNEDLKEAIDAGCDIYDIDKLQEIYNKSCPLKFIYNWKLSSKIVAQDEIAEFTEWDKKPVSKYKTIEENICPVCGDDDLDYDAVETEGNMIYYPWTCNACGAKGEEWYHLSFAGHNVKTEDGQDILEV